MKRCRMKAVEWNELNDAIDGLCGSSWAVTLSTNGGRGGHEKASAKCELNFGFLSGGYDVL